MTLRQVHYGYTTSTSVFCGGIATASRLIPALLELRFLHLARNCRDPGVGDQGARSELQRLQPLAHIGGPASGFHPLTLAPNPSRSTPNLRSHERHPTLDFRPTWKAFPGNSDQFAASHPDLPSNVQASRLFFMLHPILYHLRLSYLDIEAISTVYIKPHSLTGELWKMFGSPRI